MTRARRGASRLGCLAALLLVGAAGYFGLDFAQAYWRYYSFQDTMTQELRFAQNADDAEIVARVRAKAEELKLPRAAHQIHLRRTDRSVTVWSEYDEVIRLPGRERRLHFTPRVEKTF